MPLKETDLIYEGIASADTAVRLHLLDALKETDLIYEGIATWLNYIGMAYQTIPKKLTWFTKGLRRWL